MFPANIIANMFNFKANDFFSITDEEKENPQVKF